MSESKAIVLRPMNSLAAQKVYGKRENFLVYVPTQWSQKAVAHIDSSSKAINVSTLGFALSSLGTVVVFESTTLLTGFTELGLMVLPGGAALIGAITVASQLRHFRVKPRHKKWQPLFAEKAAELGYQAKLWLQARYDIRIDETVADEVGASMLRQVQTLTFSDISGKSHTLDRSADYYWYQHAQKEATVAVDSEANMEKVDAVGLTGEPKALVESLNSRLVRLAKINLNVENSHVVTRVVADTKEVIKLVKKIQEISPSETHSESIVNTLTILNNELADVLESALVELQDEVKIHEEYVKSRQFTPQQNLLSLTSPAKPEEVKIIQKEAANEL